GRRRASRRASSAWSRGRSATSRVPSYAPLLVLQCRFEGSERALARLAGALLLERRLDFLAAPTGCSLGDLRNRHRLDLRPGCRFLLRLGGRLLGRLRLFLSLRLSRCLASLLGRPDRLDLDPRQLAPVAGVPLVAGAAAVLPDPDLVAQLVPDDACGDGRGG